MSVEAVLADRPLAAVEEERGRRGPRKRRRCCGFLLHSRRRLVPLFLGWQAIAALRAWLRGSDSEERVGFLRCVVGGAEGRRRLGG